MLICNKAYCAYRHKWISLCIQKAISGIFLEVLMGERNNNSMDKYSGWESNADENREGDKCTKEAY